MSLCYQIEARDVAEWIMRSLPLGENSEVDQKRFRQPLRLPWGAPSVPPEPANPEAMCHTLFPMNTRAPRP
jgi:hypothetical protein